jgi:hypothetical protein
VKQALTSNSAHTKKKRKKKRSFPFVIDRSKFLLFLKSPNFCKAERHRRRRIVSLGNCTFFYQQKNKDGDLDEEDIGNSKAFKEGVIQHFLGMLEICGVVATLIFRGLMGMISHCIRRK